ncbi:MAG: TetR/AcrR family transcriptional regulator [Zymomonas mobilis]|uniref:TetR/AcrR family transcriptional regulator n=1 Tax=Zymomonas mobilis TaxID=542 RepID=UPI0039EB2378
MTENKVDTRQRILEAARLIIIGKGFSAVGLNEILQKSGVPKGSFYHYFTSKENFGEALLRQYFEDYLKSTEALLNTSKQSAAVRLMAYFNHWKETQADNNLENKCLVVKLAAEVSDLSESMRHILCHGTENVIREIAKTIEEGQHNHSLASDIDPVTLATILYQIWLGACIQMKITHHKQPLDSALIATKKLLGI